MRCGWPKRMAIRWARSFAGPDRSRARLERGGGAAPAAARYRETAHAFRGTGSAAARCGRDPALHEQGVQREHPAIPGNRLRGDAHRDPGIACVGAHAQVPRWLARSERRKRTSTRSLNGCAICSSPVDACHRWTEQTRGSRAGRGTATAWRQGDAPARLSIHFHDGNGMAALSTGGRSSRSGEALTGHSLVLRRTSSPSRPANHAFGEPHCRSALRATTSPFCAFSDLGMACQFGTCCTMEGKARHFCECGTWALVTKR